MTIQVKTWWEEKAAALPSDEFKFKVPIHVMFGEAIDICVFLDKYWKPVKATKTQPGRPGLSSAGKNLPASTRQEILDLVAAGRKAQSAYLLTVSSHSAASTQERATFVLSEISHSLSWLFDDGVEDDNDVKLAQLDAHHKDDSGSIDALASALDDYAALAAQHKEALDGLGDFDAALIDEAPKLATALREHPTTVAPETDASRVAMGQRNRILILLSDRMALARRGAHFVFRLQPKIARQASSAYERRRRAANRREAEKKAADEKAAADKAAADKAAAPAQPATPQAAAEPSAA